MPGGIFKENFDIIFEISSYEEEEGYLEVELFVDARGSDGSSECRLRQTDGQIGMDICSFASELFALRYFERDEHFFLSSGHSNCLSVLDPCRHRNCNSTFLDRIPRSLAFDAGILIELPGPRASTTSLAHDKRTLTECLLKSILRLNKSINRRWITILPCPIHYRRDK